VSDEKGLTVEGEERKQGLRRRDVSGEDGAAAGCEDDEDACACSWAAPSASARKKPSNMTPLASTQVAAAKQTPEQAATGG
jgi:hypothetical protein